MQTSALMRTVENARGLDRIADQVQAPVTRMLAKSPTARTVLHGTWLGHSLHAVMTDVPVGAWTAGIALDALELAGQDHGRHRGDAVHAVGLTAALGAAVTGLADWSHLDGAPRRVGLLHGLTNTVVAGLFAASLVARRRDQRGAGMALSTIGYGLLMFGSWLGGELTYRYGVSVNRNAFTPPGPTEWTRVAQEATLAQGQLHRVEAAGVPVLLARRDGEIRAIADTCSHLGCSLSEGRLEGDEVVCRCHGSRFHLDDGHVTAGPATDPQRRFDVRVADGNIEIRVPPEA